MKDTTKKSSRTNFFLISLRLIGLIVCLLLIFYIVDVNLLASSLKRLSGWVVIVALICAFVRLWLTSLRWQLLNSDSAPVALFSLYDSKSRLQSLYARRAWW